MPFTPFHLGPAILLGLLLLKKLDFPTFVAANALIDWRAFLVFFGLWPPPRHGWVHTYLGATLMAATLGAAMIHLRPMIDNHLREMKIIQDISNKKILTASFTGTFLHVTIDAFHHPTMQPFTPLDVKPFFGIFSTSELRAALLLCLLMSFPVYIHQAEYQINSS